MRPRRHTDGGCYFTENTGELEEGFHRSQTDGELGDILAKILTGVLEIQDSFLVTFIDAAKSLCNISTEFYQRRPLLFMKS
jgi:hypothetical protein